MEARSETVLDVGAGTGTLVKMFEEEGRDATALCYAEAAKEYCEEKDIDVEMGDIRDIPFEDDSFDTVVSSLSTCTFPNPGRTLREMARVCRPDGRIRLLEHGLSAASPVARLQTWYAPTHYSHVGCRLDQDPVAVVRRAGLEVESVRTGYLGVLTAMVVQPE